MSATAPAQDAGVLLSRESAGSVVGGSLGVLGSQRTEGGFTVYRIVFKVWSQNPDGIAVYLECETWKRFRDFQQLSKQLETLHSHSQLPTTFPRLIKTKYFDRFKEAVVEERRKSAEALLRFATSSPHLAAANTLRNFLAGARIVRIVPAAAQQFPVAPDLLPPLSSHTQPANNHTSSLTGPAPAHGHVATEQNHAAHTDSSQPQFPPNPPELRVPEAQNSPLRVPEAQNPPSSISTTRSNTPSPNHTASSSRASPNHFGGSSEFPQGPSPIPPGTNFSTDYSSTESLDAASLEHAETLMRIVTPPHCGEGEEEEEEEGESSVSEGEEDEGGGGGRGEEDEGGGGGRGEGIVEVGSVLVSEWGLQHTLKLRGEGEGEGDGGRMSGLVGVSEEGEGEGDGIEDTLTPGDCAAAREDGEREKQESNSSDAHSSPEVGNIGIPASRTAQSGTGSAWEPDSPFSLDGLPTSPLSATRRTPQPGMAWWADALAETQDMDDIDALVEQLDVTKTEPATAGKEEQRREAETGRTEGGDAGRGSEWNAAVGEGSGWEKVMGEEDGETAGVSSLSPPQRQRSRATEDGISPATGTAQGQRNRSIASSRESLDSVGGRRDQSTRSSRSTSPSGSAPSGSAPSDKVAYIVQAGRLIRLALQYEEEREYEEAFDLFKAAVDVLLNGVQTEQSRERRELVSRKTAEYLRHAESLHQTHLQASSTAQNASEVPAAMSALNSAPNSAPSSSQAAAVVQPHLLKDFKVLGLMGKTILVQSRYNGQTYVFKVLYKSLTAMAAVGKGKPKTTKNRLPTPCPNMVRLLHHYETSNHRVFLLLEHVRGGRMVELAAARRQQWQRLRAAVLNPPTSSLLLHQSPRPSLSGGRGESGEDGGESGEDGGEVVEDEEEEDAMEKMLSELTLISPPSNAPVTDSLHSGEGGEGNSESSNSLDSLALMKKRLLETMEPDPSETSLDWGGRERQARENGERMGRNGNTLGVSASTSINIEPPTPTTPSQQKTLAERDGERTNSREAGLLGDSLKPGLSDDDLLPSTGDVNKATNERVSLAKGLPGQGPPCFSPASLQNSPNASSTADDWVRRLEGSVRQWALQIIASLEHLHSNGIVWKDLNPDNVLLDMSGNAILTYSGKWDFVEPREKAELANRLYVAPELRGLEEVSPAADWWSLGAILFEVLTGRTLLSCHPEGIDSHIPLRIPCPLSQEATSLLKQLLQVSPRERLGGGLDGAEELRTHPFFSNHSL